MHLQRIFILATLGRLAIVLLTLLLDLAFKDYDTSGSLTLDCKGMPERVDKNLVVWDSVFFLRIAECGYEFEQYHAFFPGLPMILRLLSIYCTTRTALVASAVLLSNTAYILSTLLFAKLTDCIIGDNRCTNATIVFYCLSPASVFLSAIYTESFFSLATMLALCLLYIYDSSFLATLIFGLSTMFRSNGILHAGYLVHYYVCRVQQHRKHLFKELFKCILYVAICVLPFVLFERFGYLQFCSADNSVKVLRSWCQSRLPYLYGFVQKEYWYVGFLHYFQFSQVPNFLLASPVLILSLCALLSYVKRNFYNGFALGLSPSQSIKEHKGLGFYSCKVAPFVWQNGLMAIFCFLFMHVQVATRFLASSPALYWYIAEQSKNKTFRQLIVFYSLSYTFLGVLLFPNFYPWT